MSDRPRLVHLNPNGPNGAGLTPMELDAADFQSPLPVQNLHVFFEDAALGLTVGVWDTTSMQEAFGPYPGDEFIWVLEGQFAMVDGDGNEVPARAGQSVAFRNGAPMSWKQDGYLKKFFITLAGPGAAPPKTPTGQAVTIMDPNAAMEDVSEDGGPVEREHIAFINDAGNMRVGLWDCAAADFGISPFSIHEFVQILEGEAVIIEEDGTTHTVTKGSCFFIPKGTVCQWQTPTYVKKYYVQIDA